MRQSFPGAAIYKFKCRECGKRCEANSPTASFCCAKHRNDHQNRRLQRGLILYDFFMEMRYRRDRAKGLWSAMCRLAEQWRAEDLAEDPPRQSWRDPRDHIEKNPHLIGKRGRI